MEVRQDTVMSHSAESVWQDMQTKAPQELAPFELHNLLLTFLPVVLVAESDLLVIDSDDAVVADGDLVGIPAQVFDHSSRSAERGFCVNDPILLVSLLSPLSDGMLSNRCMGWHLEASQSPCCQESLEIDILKNNTHSPDRKKKPCLSGRLLPMLSLVEPTCGHDAMNMRV